MPKAHTVADEAPRTITSEQLAAELGVSTGLVDRLIAEGKIPSFKIGRRRLIDRVDLEAFIANAKQAA